MVIATAIIGLIEPRAWSIDRSNVAEICRLSCGWCGAQTMMVGCGVFATNLNRDASLKFEKKWRVSYGQAACAAFVTCKAHFSSHFSHSFPIKCEQTMHFTTNGLVLTQSDATLNWY